MSHWIHRVIHFHLNPPITNYNIKLNWSFHVLKRRLLLFILKCSWIIQNDFIFENSHMLCLIKLHCLRLWKWFFIQKSYNSSFWSSIITPLFPKLLYFNNKIAATTTDDPKAPQFSFILELPKTKYTFLSMYVFAFY